MTDWLEQLSKVMQPRLRMMNEAAEYVMALGYQPSDCLIESRQDASGFIDRERLLVRGEPFFELTFSKSSWLDTGDEYKITFTAEPRVITWPPMTAPQVRASSDAGPP